jgi:fibronectin-binding autotransporter adhesin
MQSRHRRSVLLAAIAAASGICSIARATDYSWLNLSGGAFNWDNASNWSPSGFPQNTADTANISGAFSGAPVITLPAVGGPTGGLSVSKLTIGDTSAAHNPITIASSGANLVLDAGAAAISTDDTNAGNDGTIFLAGAVGGTETISARIQLGSVTNSASSLQYVVTGPSGFTPFALTPTSNLNLSGGIVNSMGGGATTATRALVNAGTGIITIGDVALSDSAVTGNLQLGGAGIAWSTASGDDNPITSQIFATGNYVLNGIISNGPAASGNLILGNTQGATVSVTPLSSGNPRPQSPQPTYIINAVNTYTGNTTLGRGLYILKNDRAFGGIGSSGTFGTITEGGTSFKGAYNINIQSDVDNRVIPNPITLSQDLQFSGNHSIKLTGNITQSQNREMSNNIGGGKTLTMEGFYTSNVQTDNGRNIVFDGSGTTLLSGPIYNARKPWGIGFGASDTTETNTDGTPNSSAMVNLQKNGTGVLTINPTVLPTYVDPVTSATFSGPSSTMRGITTVNGGLLQFANSKAYGKLDADFGGIGTTVNGVSNTFISAATTGTGTITVNTNGAVALLTGAFADPYFMSKLNQAGNSQGALALADVVGDRTANIDFTGVDGTAVNFSGAGVKNMSIGAALSGVTYTGTITPNPANGYRLGGGGVLTLPNNNALVGANAVTITNGGKVVVSGTNNYTGVTTIRGDYLASNQGLAYMNAGTGNIGTWSSNVRENATLAISVLAPGGSPSSMGASSAAASNLVINGGTLQFIGGAGSTDRLFTVGPAGATLDSSGSGAVAFTDGSNAIVLTDSPSVSGTLNANNNPPSGTQQARVVTGVSSAATPNIVAGMAVSGTGIQPGTTIISVTNNSLGLSLPALTSGVGVQTLTFTNQNRNLNLTGTNTGDNTLAPILTDSAAGKLGIVKSGASTWVLTGSNTYTGTTTVQAGTLKIGANAQAPLLTNAGGTDIQGGKVLFAYSGSSPASSINAQLATSFAANGFVNNTQIRSSTATAKLGLGMSDDGSNVTVGYTYYGDANVDGAVNALDFNSLATNFGATSGKFWYQGDFNYDGKVNSTDFAALAANFNSSLVPAPAPSLGALVPEPAITGLLSGLALLAARRRRAR